jgi:GntR family transcriptional regulator/MocR family aminotransferase
MRSLYADRRRALANALRAVFDDRIILELEAGGMHLLARFPCTADDGAMVRRATAAGLAPTALSGLVMGHDCGQGLVLAFTNVPEAEADAIVARLAAAIEA